MLFACYVGAEMHGCEEAHSITNVVIFLFKKFSMGKKSVPVPRMLVICDSSSLTMFASLFCHQRERMTGRRAGSLKYGAGSNVFLELVDLAGLADSSSSHIHDRAPYIFR